MKMKPALPELATKTKLARVPYLNCAPFFHGLEADRTIEWVDLPPRRLGAEAEAGQLVGGPMALADYLRLQDRFERVGHFGVAARGRCGSALLFSARPIRLLDGATILVTDQSSTTARLLRLILEQRYELAPAAYRRGTLADLEGAPAAGIDGVLLIGDDALRFHATNRRFPYETDLAFEWWLWQHLPAVFAVLVVRKDAEPQVKQRVTRILSKGIATNLGRLSEVAATRAGEIGIPADELTRYLEQFVYRFGEPEERAIRQFGALLHEHDLL